MSGRSNNTLVLAGLLACTSCLQTQDLGRDERSPDDKPQTLVDESQGFGAGWACPIDGHPLARDLACPLTMPKDLDDCTAGSSAPCMYGDESVPSVCICTSDRHWSCMQPPRQVVHVRTLANLPRTGDRCLDAVEVARPCGTNTKGCEIVCRCVDGYYQCGGS